MIKNIGKELWKRRKNKQAYPCYLLFAFSVYFLFSYFLPFSYSYGKGHLQDISGFSMFAFRQAEGYLARTANRRLISYVAAGLILFVSVLAVLSWLLLDCAIVLSFCSGCCLFWIFWLFCVLPDTMFLYNVFNSSREFIFNK